MNNQTIGDRLRIAMGDMGENELARRSGVPQSTIHRILTGVSKDPRRSNLEKLARVLNRNADWLQSGTGPEFIADGKAPDQASVGTYNSPADLNPDDYVWIEHYDVKLSAGNGTPNAEWVLREGDPICFRWSWMKRKGLVADLCKAMYVRGNSMYPELKDGDSIVINTADTDPVDGEIYAFAYNNRLYIKTFEQLGSGVRLRSDNHPDFDHIDIPEDDLGKLKVLGKKAWRAG